MQVHSTASAVLVQLQAKHPLYICPSIWHPTEVQFAFIGNRFWPAVERPPAAVKEGRKTQRATATAHNHRTRAAWAACHPSLPQAAHRPTEPTATLSPPPRASAWLLLCLPPTMSLQAAVVGRAAGREMGGGRLQRSCQPLPGDDGGRFPRFPRPHRRVTLRVSATTSPPVPPAGTMGRGAPAELTSVGSVVQNTGPAGPQTGA